MSFVPFEDAGIVAYRSFADWEATSAGLLATMLARWQLDFVTPLPAGSASVAAAVRPRQGGEAVLKLSYPHEESRHEAVALELMPAGSAPRPLLQDPWAWALLEERVTPGLPLGEVSPAEAIAVAGELHRRLRDAKVDAVGNEPPLPLLADVAAGWSAGMTERLRTHAGRIAHLGLDSALLARAADRLGDLAGRPGSRTLVHGDFNPGNILHGGDGWVAIDPKAMLGDPAYDLWPLVSQVGHPFESPRALAAQVSAAADAAQLDAMRVTEWAFARAAESVLWCVAMDHQADAVEQHSRLRVWHAVLGG